VRRIVVAVVALLAGLVVAVVAGEAACAWRDDLAFPHLNVYEPDADLGVRLRPHATTRVAFGGNPATDVRTNDRGLRGADWGPPVPGEVIVVGDSQVFGLGVQEDETASAVLATRLGVPVRNAGVPTYGPQEYVALAKALIAERRPAAVVLVLNQANDWFEAHRPNRERHRVWDGWAVRAETAPTEPEAWWRPTWAYQRSHLGLALRRWWWSGVPTPDVGLPSEGGVEDLLGSAHRAVVDHDVAEARVVELRRQAEAAYAEALTRRQDDLALAEDELAGWLARVDRTVGWDVADAVAAVRRGAHPGDIVEAPYVESARPVPLTAELLLRAARLRRDLPTRARAWLAGHPDHADAARVREELATYEALRAPPAPAAVPSAPPPTSVLKPAVWRFRDACAAVGATPVVVPLPLDVVVDPAEWAKYGAVSEDMTETEVLLDDLRAVATDLGAVAVDPMPALRAAEPGAFLRGDLHLSAKGHAALADAIAAALSPAGASR
jgi:hypothetical protein